MKVRGAISISLSALLVAATLTIGDHQKSKLFAATYQRLSNGHIIQVNGDVQLERKGRIVRPTAGTRLYPGDRLKTAGGSQVLIQCADLAIESVQPGRNYLNQCAIASEPGCPEDMYKCPKRGGDTIALNRSTIPYIISPRRTKLLNPKPRFRWNAVPDTTSYQLKLRENGVKLNWQMVVSGTEAIYPGEVSLKSGAEYKLIVETDRGVSSEDVETVGGVTFSLLDENQASLVRTALEEIDTKVRTQQAKVLAKTRLYLKHKLIAEAIESLESLVKDGVETAPVSRTLAELYSYVGLVPEAEKYYVRANTLADASDLEEQAAVQDGLGQTYVALKKDREAIAHLKAAMEGYKTLGDLERAGELDRQLQKLASDSPGDFLPTGK